MTGGTSRVKLMYFAIYQSDGEKGLHISGAKGVNGSVSIGQRKIIDFIQCINKGDWPCLQRQLLVLSSWAIALFDILHVLFDHHINITSERPWLAHV